MSALEDVLADLPDVASCLDDVHRAAWATVDPALLELCRLRIAMLLGCAADEPPPTGTSAVDERARADLASWPTSPRFGPREQACLAFCEQFVIDVAGLTDETASAVAGHLGPQGLVDFTAALLVVEQRLRLRLAWERLLAPETA